MLLPIFVGEDWKWNLTFSEFFFATEGKILGDFFQKMSGPMSGETKVKMPFLQQKKKLRLCPELTAAFSWEFLFNLQSEQRGDK